MKQLRTSVLLVAVLMACGSGKQSAVEGKLQDWNGKPVARVKITAAQVQPIPGYEQFEAVTKTDGTFRLSGLFPSSKYVLKPWSDKWTCQTEVSVDSAPDGETNFLPLSIVIEEAFSKGSSSSITDLATGATRFAVSSDGVITDTQSGLEWIVGPNRDMNYAQAEQWVAGSNLGGGGWRLPTHEELVTLQDKGLGDSNIDPVFFFCQI